MKTGLEKVSLQHKKEALGKSKKIDEFRPMAEQYKTLHRTDSNLRELDVASTDLSRVMPRIFIKKITIDDNPDSSAFLDDASRNPHIAITQVSGRHKGGGVKVSRKPVTVGSTLNSPIDDERFSVRVVVNIKQIFDDDNIVYEILKTLGILKFLRLKIVAVVDSPSTWRRIKGQSIHLLRENREAGIYVIPDRSGLHVPYGYTEDKLSSMSNEIEISSDGEVIKNTTIEKGFVFDHQPDDLIIFAQLYFDVFDNPELESEMGLFFGTLLEDADLKKILVGKKVSEKVFENGELLNYAAIFTETDPSLGSLAAPYLGEILEVRSGMYAKPAKTGPGGSRNHKHLYYVDNKGIGWTSVHTDANGNKHMHMINAFTVSNSGKFKELEERFVAFKNTHNHNLPISTSNALYRKRVPVNYIIDNRSKGSLRNMKLELDKTMEDTFSFLAKVRKRSNFIKPLNGSSELSSITGRESKVQYFTPAYYASDLDGNCRFTFMFDDRSFLRDNTAFGKYIGDWRKLSEYAPINSIRIVRKRINHYEYDGLSAYSKYNFEYGFKDQEVEICRASMSMTRNKKNKRLEGISDVASLTEYTPAGTHKTRSRRARYFMCMDKSYTTTAMGKNTTNAAATLNSGIYAYGVEISMVDNTIDYLVEAQSLLHTKIKDLENYIAIGQRRGNYTGITREFTKAFQSKTMDDMAKKIVNETLMMLRRLFLKKSQEYSELSGASFTAKANKMFNLIRPRTGNLFAAEKYLSELYQIVSYLKGITRIDEVGKYSKERRGAQGSSGISSSGIPVNKKTKIVRAKHYFKDCFKKDKFLGDTVEYFTRDVKSIIGLSKVPISGRNSYSTRQLPFGYSKKTAVIVPKYIRLASDIGDRNFFGQPKRLDLINEQIIRKVFFAPRRHAEGGFGSAGNYGSSGTKIFEIFDNQALLKDNKSSGVKEIATLKGVFGSADIQDQIDALQETGYLKEHRRTRNAEGQYNIEYTTRGEELTEVLGEFLNSNRAYIMYFSGFATKGGSFVPSWSVLNERRIKSLSTERRPILCKLVQSRGYSSEESDVSQKRFSMNVCNEVFLMTPPNSLDYRPTGTRETNVLTGQDLSYNSELMTTNPDVKNAEGGKY